MKSVLLLVAAAASSASAWRIAATCASTRSRSVQAFAAPAKEKPPPPTPEAIATMVERSFVPAVMGVSRGDVTELKLFFAAVRASFQLGFELDDLGVRMRALPVQSAGRPLADEEDDLRQLWMALIYMTLQRQGGGDGGDALVPALLSSQHQTFVDGVLAAKEAAQPLSQLSIDELCGDGVERSAMEKAVLQQSTKVIYTAIDALADIEAAGDRADAPRPFIPGQEGPVS